MELKKKALAVAVAAVLAAPMAAHAVKYSLSGQTTQALYLVDTGQSSDYSLGGAGFSPSRFELKGNQDIGNGMKAGFHWEVGHAVGGNPGIRYMNGSLGGNFGTLTLGQVSDANDNAAFSDLAGNGAWMALEASCDHATGTMFRDSGGSYDLGGTGVAEEIGEVTTDDGNSVASVVVTPAVAGTPITVGTACPSFDGGRSAGLRYDSPAGPVNVSFSLHNDDKWASMIQASGKAAGGMTWDARFGYQDQGGDGSSYWAAGGGIKFPSKTSINITHGQSDSESSGKETTGWMAKIAHDIDKSAFTLIYRQYKDIYSSACTGGYCKSNSVGVGGTHVLGDSGVTLGVGYQRHDLDNSIVEAEEVNIFYVTSRVRFN